MQTIDKSSKQINSLTVSYGNDKASNDSDSDSANSDAETTEETTNQINPACSLGSSSLYLVSNDPGKWPAKINPSEVQFIIENFPPQIKDFNFPRDRNNRKFSENYYYRTLPNQDKIHRPWLLYSVSLNSVFCAPCKLFCCDESSRHLLNGSSGVSDWQHLAIILKRHESSAAHIKNSQKMFELFTALRKGLTVDSAHQRLYEMEKKHWGAVIERLLSIVKFLSKQCLAFRGSSNKLFESNNGNYLQLVEMVSKFDAVLSEHLRRVELRNKNTPHYLGWEHQNELIVLLANSVQDVILNQIRESKYFSIILDCTPDITHTEQITIIIRCVSTSGPVRIFEYFLGFSPVIDVTGQGLFEFIENKLKELNLNMNNLRGQGYDNGANMRGKHIGLQKKILEKYPRAFFIPCSAHSLNLVVNDAVKISFESVEFFNTVQELYVFFSSSNIRWNVLLKHLPKLTLKALSETRWESRIDAITPLKTQIGEIYDALEELENDNKRDMNTRTLAKSLKNKNFKFKFMCSVVMWQDILSKINVVSKILQSPKFDIKSSLDALNNLKNYFMTKRSDEDFQNFLIESREIATKASIEEAFPSLPTQRIRRKKRHFEYEGADEPIASPELSFKVNFYFKILDAAITAIEERFQLLQQHTDIFNVIYAITKIGNDDELKINCEKINQALTDTSSSESDISATDLYEEIKAIEPFFTTEKNPSDILEYIYENNLLSTFPNLTIIVRIFLTLPVTVATGERSFSKLKIIKNYLRSSMTQDRLSALAMLSIEHEVCATLNTKDIVKKFSEMRARKICF